MTRWTCSCFLYRRPRRKYKKGSKNFGFSNCSFSESCITDEKCGMSIVELVKKEGSTLGIILSGGADKGYRPRITNLRPGSIAHRSDELSIGDHIGSINGIRTENLKHEEIVNLLKNAEDKVVLELEYAIPDAPIESIMNVCSKAVQIRLRKDNGSFGFTVRGGACDEKLNTRPLIITQVRPGSSADREGTIKPGDRLLAVDSYNLSNASHSEALHILKQLEGDSIFTIEYDISIMDCVKNASGPLLIEIEKNPGSQIGVALSSSTNGSEPVIIIESIKQASIAERSGALHVGDQILAVDGTRVDQMTPDEVMQLIRLNLTEAIKLEIFPLSQLALQRVPDTIIRKGSRTPPATSSIKKYQNSSCNSNFSYNTLSSMTGLAAKYSRHKRGKNMPRKNSLSGSDLNSTSTSSSLGVTPGPCMPVCRTETTEVTLMTECRSFGFALKPGNFNLDTVVCFPVIANIDPDGPAERSGVMQTGDRLLAINRQRTNQLPLEEITQLIVESKPRVTLEIEFDVAESVVPSSGTFTVKLPKHDGGLGISITSPHNKKYGDALMISHVKKGSVSHRSGTLQPGDQLLAIDNIRMDNCTIEDAAQILQNAENIVQLKIKKDEEFSEDLGSERSIIYTMELKRHGGPLGITISGSEESFDPIIISGLTSNGLAEKTGALHVGDRLLAINGDSLRGKPLTEAIQMLQNSGDVVTLKICKDFSSNFNEEKSEHNKSLRDIYKICTPLPSVDSAVESWDSSGVSDANNSGPGSQAASSRPNSGCQDNRACGEDSSKRSSQVSSLNDESVLTAWRREKFSRDSPHKSFPSENGHEDWPNILEDLETCGQSLILRQLEKSLMNSDDESASLVTSAFETVKRNPNVDLSKGPQTCGSLRYNKWRDQQAECDRLKSTRNGYGTLPHSATRLVRTDGVIGEDQVYPGTDIPIPSSVEIHRVTLFKDSVYEDFGFSVSDGLFERGVYINRIRPGGPADLCGLLKPFDHLLQVNITKTEDFDCCLTVPLIAASGDQIEIVFSRNPNGVKLSTKSSNGNPSLQNNFNSNCSSPSSPQLFSIATKIL